MSGHRASNVEPLRPKRPCPECGRPSSRDAYPFCSTRCKDVDLHRWLSGAYVIPGTEEEAEDATPPDRSAGRD
ncbi:MAG: DNA gyrase inhibitor YacG [Rhizobiaceae bacterium]|nr:DNA gyrase inhibitor YacG [Rhizobiaceae bacterium]